MGRKDYTRLCVCVRVCVRVFIEALMVGWMIVGEKIVTHCN